MPNDFNISALLNDSDKEPAPLKQFEALTDSSTSPNYSGKENITKDLFNVQSTESPFDLSPKLGELPNNVTERQKSDSDSVTLWKNVENISARLIEHYDDTVVLECLLDKELGLYEEREFRSSLFTGYELKVGNLFYLRFFDRKNETKMEIHNDPRLTSIEDFPKKDFTELFKKSKLFKK